MQQQCIVLDLIPFGMYPQMNYFSSTPSKWSFLLSLELSVILDKIAISCVSNCPIAYRVPTWKWYQCRDFAWYICCQKWAVCEVPMYAENIKRQQLMLTTKMYINNLHMNSDAPGEKYGLEHQCPMKYYPQKYKHISSILTLNWNIIRKYTKLHHRSWY